MTRRVLTIALCLSLGLHLIILLFALSTWQAKSLKQTVKPNYVMAKVVSLKPVEKAPKPKAVKPKPKKQPEKRQAPKKPKPKPKKDNSAEKKRAAELVKKKAAEKKAAQKKAAEKKRQAEAKKLADAKKAKELAAEKAKQAAEKKRQQEELRKEQEELNRRMMAEELLEDALEEEQALLDAEEDEALAYSYMDSVRRSIQRYWSRPASARNGMVVELRIYLIPTGDVVNVAIAKSSGDTAFDRAAVNAVKKAGGFPELKALPNHIFEQYYRQFTIKFNPEDLRR